MQSATRDAELIADLEPRPAKASRCGGRFRSTAAVLALCLAALLWQGADRVPCGPAGGADLRSAGSQSSAVIAPTTRATFRIGTFNIHSGRGADTRLDLDRTARLLSDLDVIGLNEVQGCTLLGGNNQAELLGQKLGHAWLFAPTERRWWHDHFGNGLLATCPTGPWLRIPLPATQGKGFRNALLLTIRPGKHPVNLLVTHLDRTQDRQAQLAAVSGLFLSLAEPAILMGDLNTPAADPQMRNLLTSPGVQDALQAASNGSSSEHIDWILVRGLRVVNAAAVPNDASDHPALRAELAVPE